MGIFTSNGSLSLSSEDTFRIIDVPTNESYNDVTGCGIAVLETCENDYSLFKAQIQQDFSEVAAIHEGYEVINEGAKDILDKIKEIFKKLLSKIKGILQAFLAKILGTFLESDKLYNRYLKTITSHSDWEGFKVKNYREPKSDDVTKSILNIKYDMNAFNYSTISKKIVKESYEFFGNDILNEASKNKQLEQDIATAFNDAMQHMKNNDESKAINTIKQLRDKYKSNKSFNPVYGEVISIYIKNTDNLAELNWLYSHASDLGIGKGSIAKVKEKIDKLQGTQQQTQTTTQGASQQTSATSSATQQQSQATPPHQPQNPKKQKLTTLYSPMYKTLEIDPEKAISSNGYDNEELDEKIINARIGSTLGNDIDKLTDFDKAYMDAVFNDPETQDNWDSSMINSTNIGMLLHKNSGKKFKQLIQNTNKDLTNCISKIINELEKWQKEAVDKLAKGTKSGTYDSMNYKQIDISKDSRTSGSYTADAYKKSGVSSSDKVDYNYSVKFDDDSIKDAKVSDGNKKISSKEDYERVIKVIAFLQKLASREQTIISHYTSARLKTTKFALSQARRVWTSAAAYASRKHEGVDYDYYTAVGEAAQYDFDSDMEALSYNI